MLKIGITGNIGSGKTTVSKIFELLGVPVFYADWEAKEVMTNDSTLINDIKSAFGKESYFDNGALNRKHLASIVFNNSDELKKLNSLVHPAVFRVFDQWVKNHPKAPYVLKEAAILFESGSYKLCDYSILVKAPLQTRIERVVKRDMLSAAEIERRDEKQFSEEKKSSLANIFINNDGSELVIPQVLKLHGHFLSMGNGSA
jgi:dephospho-CoA kinase